MGSIQYIHGLYCAFWGKEWIVRSFLPHILGVETPLCSKIADWG